MADQSSETQPSINSDYVIETIDNLSQQYDRDGGAGRGDDTTAPGIQVPFILNIRGPLSLRGKQNPYKVTKG